MAYDKRLTRNDPGCLMFLIDQSASMNEPIAGRTEETKATALANAINDLLYETVLACIKDSDEGPRHYYDIAVIGYGSSIRSALPDTDEGRELVSSVELGQNHRRLVNVSTAEGDVNRPVWVDPLADGTTPMCAAFDRAGSIVAQWITQHPDSFPPIVVNLSDGASTDGDPSEWATRIRSLGTSDGNVLLFNLNISSSGGEEVIFPATPHGLPDELARMLFHISSDLPAYMVTRANQEGLNVAPDAKGFGYNARFQSVVSFLRVGTSTVQDPN